MTLGYRPKVGDILHCDFGRFIDTNGDRITDNDLSCVDYTNFDGRIPPEIIKQRLVMVLNPKVGGGCIVVPISSREDEDQHTQDKYHVALPYQCIEKTTYEDTPRWIKANLIQMVSLHRLKPIYRADRNRLQLSAPRDLVTEVQKAVIRVINATALLGDG